MESAGHVAVVGGSLAGLRTAEQLRAHGHTGPITVFGAERHFPYNRPPLSKEALAEGNWPSAGDLAGALAFRRRATVSDVDFRLGTPIVAADLTAQRLFDRNARSADYDGLVIATGLRPRRLSVPGPDGGRHVLRTVEDCVQLRAALAGPRRVVVVGGGFIGCEVAATLRVLGHHVTVVDPAGPPMQRVLGPELAEAVRRHHCAAGIEFVIGAGVAAFCGAETVSGVVLDTGQTLAADVVVEAIGSHCNVEWLAGQGLDLATGRSPTTTSRSAAPGTSSPLATSHGSPIRCLTTSPAASSTGRSPQTPPNGRRQPCWKPSATNRLRRFRRSGATSSICVCRVSVHRASVTRCASRRAVSRI